jgi:hypothetical protein
LGRTIKAWFDKIAIFHLARVSNGPTEAFILWSGQSRVFDVADRCVSMCRRLVLWSPSLTSTTSSIP